MRKKILVVDDEERVLGLLEAVLDIDDRFEVISTKDGEEALAVCRQQKPDLVFLDLLLPGMDGYSVCRRLKQSVESSSIKVVILTAMAQEAERHTAAEIGADDYLTKPFSPTDLICKVEELLGR